MSIPIKISATLVVFTFCVLNCFGQSDYGCYITPVGGAPQTRIYFTREPGSQTSPVRFYSASGYIQVDCPSGASTSVSHAVVTGDYGSSRIGCWAQRKAGAATAPNPNPNNAGEYDYNGYLVYYRIQQCPIDDYIPLMLVGVAGAAFVMVRRKVFV